MRRGGGGVLVDCGLGGAYTDEEEYHREAVECDEHGALVEGEALPPVGRDVERGWEDEAEPVKHV